MRQFKLNLIQNDEYHKVIDTWSENSSDLNIAEHIETIVKKRGCEKMLLKAENDRFYEAHGKNRFYML